MVELLSLVNADSTNFCKIFIRLLPTVSLNCVNLKLCHFFCISILWNVALSYQGRNRAITGLHAKCDIVSKKIKNKKVYMVVIYSIHMII